MFIPQLFIYSLLLPFFVTVKSYRLSMINDDRKISCNIGSILSQIDHEPSWFMPGILCYRSIALGSNKYLSSHLPIFLSSFLPFFLSSFLPFYLSSFLLSFLASFLSSFMAIFLRTSTIDDGIPSPNDDLTVSVQWDRRLQSPSSIGLFHR